VSDTTSSSVTAVHLREHQRLATSGARAVASIAIGGRSYLAIPQLAEDVAGAPADMNGGNSDVDAVVYGWREDEEDFREIQRLPVHGGEDVEPFTIDGDHYLAVACIRSGHGPYDMHPNSTVYRWNHGRYEVHQEIPTFAAKLWRHFSFEGRHFLVVAAGVAPEFATGEPGSTVYEWSGERFEPFQTLPSVWAYDWEFFELESCRYLGLSDHVTGMQLFRWRDGRFEPFQSLGEAGARDMAFRRIAGSAYLACANLLGPSQIYRWSGESFAPCQSLDGAGGRRFKFVQIGDGLHLVRINFISGPREHPVTQLASQIYTWAGDRFALSATFATSGGTDAAHIRHGAHDYLVVSNSLSEEVRFRTDSIVYRWDSSP
jgi:hypothetical protein